MYIDSGSSVHICKLGDGSFVVHASVEEAKPSKKSKMPMMNMKESSFSAKTEEELMGILGTILPKLKAADNADEFGASFQEAAEGMED